MANEYLSKHQNEKVYQQAGTGKKYRPFEEEGIDSDFSKQDVKALMSQLDQLHSFTFKAAPIPLSIKILEEEKKTGASQSQPNV